MRKLDKIKTQTILKNQYTKSIDKVNQPWVDSHWHESKSHICQKLDDILLLSNTKIVNNSQELKTYVQKNNLTLKQNPKKRGLAEDNF